MAFHPYRLRSSSPSISRKPPSTPSPSGPTRRRRSARTSARPSSNMATVNVNWSDFARSPVDLPPLSDPPSAIDVSNIDFARAVITNYALGTKMTDDQKQVHTAVIDQAFTVQLHRIAPQVRKDEIIDPTMAQLRQELGPIVQDAIAGNQTQASQGLQQSIQTLQGTVNALRDSVMDLQESTRKLEDAVDRQGRNLGKRIAETEKKLEKQVGDLEKKLVKRSDEIFTLLAQTANRQAADGSVQPYLVIPFNSGVLPDAEQRILRNTPRLPLLKDVNTLLNLERADLDSYLTGYGLESTGDESGDKTLIGTFIGVNATLLPD